jgi:hypothetical protein
MNKIILWAPRVIALILILFISLFAFDGFVPGISGYEKTLAFVIGLLPAIILALALILAWFFKLAGGITFVTLGIAMTLFFHTYKSDLSFLTLSSPVLVVGILFILSYYYEKAAPRK